MKQNFQKEIVGGFFITIIGAMAGIASSYITAFCLALFQLFSNEKRDYGASTIDSSIHISVLLTVVIGSLVAGFIVAIISSRKGLIYAAITGIALIIVWMIINDFKFPYFKASEKISTYLILPFTVVGGWLGFKYKSRKKSGS